MSLPNLSLGDWICDLFPYYCNDGQANVLFLAILGTLLVGIVALTLWLAVDDDSDEWYWLPVATAVIFILALAAWFCISLLVTGFIVWTPLRMIVFGLLALTIVTLLGRAGRKLFVTQERK